MGTQPGRDIFVDRLVSVAKETLDGKIETLSRLLKYAPEVAREKVWELFKDQCRENPAVFQTAVTNYLNAKGAPA